MLALLVAWCTARVSCRDVTGSEVDWFAAFKVPTMSGDREPSHAAGVGYFYHDDSVPLSEAAGDVNSTVSNPLFHTLGPLYGGDCNVGYALFSDQPPGTDKDAGARFAHLKGVVLFDADSGLYLSHSVPNFPPAPAPQAEGAGFAFPESGTRYGQAFECMSLSHGDLEKLCAGLLIARPFTYARNLPAFTESVLPSLVRVVDDDYEKEATSGQEVLTTSGGSRFTMLTKSRQWGRELYHDLVAPTFGENVNAETWALGVGNLPSNCSGQFETHNIMKVSFDGVEWARTKDHSKWAIAGNTVCIGDINRQNGQLVRGGTTYCKTDDGFAEKMESVVADVQECESET